MVQYNSNKMLTYNFFHEGFLDFRYVISDTFSEMLYLFPVIVSKLYICALYNMCIYDIFVVLMVGSQCAAHYD